MFIQQLNMPDGNIATSAENNLRGLQNDQL